MSTCVNHFIEKHSKGHEHQIKEVSAGNMMKFSLLNEMRFEANDDPIFKQKKGDVYITIDRVRIKMSDCSPFELAGVEEILQLVEKKLWECSRHDLQMTYDCTMKEVEHFATEHARLGNMMKNKGDSLYSMLGSYYRGLIAIFDTSRGMTDAYKYELEQKLDSKYYGWCKAMINRVLKQK